jgi:hypothetical protein
MKLGCASGKFPRAADDLRGHRSLRGDTGRSMTGCASDVSRGHDALPMSPLLPRCPTYPAK